MSVSFSRDVIRLQSLCSFHLLLAESAIDARRTGSAKIARSG